MISHLRYRRLLLDFVADDIASTATTRKIWAHVVRCEHCRAHYDRLVESQRLLVTGGLNREDAVGLEWLPLLPMVSGQQRKQARRAGSWGYRLGLAAAAAAILLIAIVNRDDTSEFRARDGSTPSLAVRVLCQTSSDGGTQVGPLTGLDQNQCPVDGQLRFAYRTNQAAQLFLLQSRDGEAWGMVGDGLEVEDTSSLASLQLTLPLAQAGELHLAFLLLSNEREVAESRAQIERGRQPETIAKELRAVLVERRILVIEAREGIEP